MVPQNGPADTAFRCIGDIPESPVRRTLLGQGSAGGPIEVRTPRRRSTLRSPALVRARPCASSRWREPVIIPRRSGERELHPQAGPCARRAVEKYPAAERFQPVLQAGQACAPRSCSASRCMMIADSDSGKSGADIRVSRVRPLSCTVSVGRAQLGRPALQLSLHPAPPRATAPIPYLARARSMAQVTRSQSAHPEDTPDGDSRQLGLGQETGGGAVRDQVRVIVLGVRRDHDQRSRLPAAGQLPGRQESLRKSASRKASTARTRR